MLLLGPFVTDERVVDINKLMLTLIPAVGKSRSGVM